ncbi:MAG: hypothetical protein FWB80_11090 [Defluviitaleaceae bacterium]|nr:hypothetical protein [Defluviitaleaceae bacterium]
MYEVIKEPKRMTAEEINASFKGKWVLTARPEPKFSLYQTAIPLVIADAPFEGDETGMYDKLSDEYDGDIMHLTHLMGRFHVFGFSEVPIDYEN